MKTIIVATDFSPIALNAAKYGVDMAKAVGADILLFNVYEVLPNYGEIFFDVNIENLKKSSHKEIVKFKSLLLKQCDFDFNITTEIRMGVFKDELSTISKTLNPYAIIMGCQGKSATEHFLMGSHAGKSMNDFTCPIITVPPTFTFSGIKKIGIAYDFEVPVGEALISDVKLFLKDFNATIDILNVAPEDEFRKNFVLLSHMLEKAFKPLIVTYHFLASDKTEESILNFIYAHGIDLLVVMPKHHNLFQKLFQKSHSKQLILHSQVPVMALN